MSFYAKNSTVGSAWRKSNGYFLAAERWNLNVGTKGGFRKSHRKAHQKVLALVRENRVRFDVQMNEKITRFSVEKLMDLSTRLGFSVTIHIEGNGVKVDVPVQSAA